MIDKRGMRGYTFANLKKEQRHMKKIAIVFVTVVLAVCAVLGTGCAAAPAESKELKLGTSADYPPFEFIILDAQNQQQYVGIDISVAKQITADQGKELVVMNMDFDSLMAGLQKGDVDFVIAAIEENEERKEAADFSDPYYTDLPPMILVKADKAAEYTSVESFAGKSVGAQTGTTKADIVKDDLPGANLVALTSVTDLVNQLVYDKVDAIVLDGAVAQQYAQSNSALAVANVSLGEAYPYCVAVQKGDPKNLLPGINATIAKLLKDGSIEKFAEEADALSDQAIE